MELDDELCLCFHVTKRKVVNFIRIEQPRRAAQLSECFGAGTGCGWCRPFLRKLLEQAQHASANTAAESSDALPDAGEYAAGRSQYVADGKGTPPAGTTPP
jgi:NAD(P)H-nitrite reductase large subunit